MDKDTLPFKTDLETDQHILTRRNTYELVDGKRTIVGNIIKPVRLAMEAGNSYWYDANQEGEVDGWKQIRDQVQTTEAIQAEMLAEALSTGSMTPEEVDQHLERVEEVRRKKALAIEALSQTGPTDPEDVQPSVIEQPTPQVVVTVHEIVPQPSEIQTLENNSHIDVMGENLPLTLETVEGFKQAIKEKVIIKAEEMDVKMFEMRSALDHLGREIDGLYRLLLDENAVQYPARLLEDLRFTAEQTEGAFGRYKTNKGDLATAKGSLAEQLDLLKKKVAQFDSDSTEAEQTLETGSDERRVQRETTDESTHLVDRLKKVQAELDERQTASTESELDSAVDATNDFVTELKSEIFSLNDAQVDMNYIHSLKVRVLQFYQNAEMPRLYAAHSDMTKHVNEVKIRAKVMDPTLVAE